MPKTPTWTPARVVSWNLVRARHLRGWTQAEAAEQLATFLGGPRWTSANFSLAETGWRRADRQRAFGADELAAMARAFRVPLDFFFEPPADTPIKVGSPGAEAIDGEAFAAAMRGDAADVDRRAIRLEVLDEITAAVRAANDKE
jgi:transcriptional regulator with XRE-family HTH domain